MRIKIEPKEFFMYAVFLAFSKERPAAKDEAIKAYLDAHELIPKAQGTDRFEDHDFEVMYFGGCYLGTHLQVIEDMQRQAVERGLLTVESSISSRKRQPLGRTGWPRRLLRHRCRHSSPIWPRSSITTPLSGLTRQGIWR